MPRQFVFGLHAEGNSDYRFLSILLEKVIVNSLFELDMEADLLPIIPLKGKDGTSFIEKMNEITSEGSGLSGIIVHMDADSRTTLRTMQNKWNPFQNQYTGSVKCIPLISAHKIESWML